MDVQQHAERQSWKGRGAKPALRMLWKDSQFRKRIAFTLIYHAAQRAVIGIVQRSI